jgi:hypothetical protein
MLSLGNNTQSWEPLSRKLECQPLEGDVRLIIRYLVRRDIVNLLANNINVVINNTVTLVLTYLGKVIGTQSNAKTKCTILSPLCFITEGKLYKNHGIAPGHSTLFK